MARRKKKIKIDLEPVSNAFRGASTLFNKKLKPVSREAAVEIASALAAAAADIGKALADSAENIGTDLTDKPVDEVDGTEPAEVVEEPKPKRKGKPPVRPIDENYDPVTGIKSKKRLGTAIVKGITRGGYTGGKYRAKEVDSSSKGPQRNAGGLR